MFCRYASAKICCCVFITCAVLSSLAYAQESSTLNHPPSISEINLANPQIHKGIDIELQPVATDQEEDPISFTYQWFINGVEVPDNNTAVLPRDLFSREDRIAVMITPSDGKDTGPTFTTKEFAIPNAPPHLSTAKAPAFDGSTLEYQVEASDPDGDRLSYSISGAPEGMTIDSRSGMLSYVRKPGDQGTYNIDIIISDNLGGVTTASFTLTLN